MDQEEKSQKKLPLWSLDTIWPAVIHSEGDVSDKISNEIFSF